LPFLSPGERVLVGLPDTIWYPENGLRLVGNDALSFLLFPVKRPELFDAVIADENGRVKEIRVKRRSSGSSWIWGAFKMPERVLRELYDLWGQRGRCDEYMGTLVNAYIERGGDVRAVFGGESYVDVGTLGGYREAMALLSARTDPVATTAPVVEGVAVSGRRVLE